MRVERYLDLLKIVTQASIIAMPLVWRGIQCKGT